jgi:hypothetical protein
LFILLFIVAGASEADQVVWDYDLTSPPPGWIIDDEWNFSSAGASIYGYKEGMCYWGYGGSMLTESVTIPGGCDSVVLHVEQDLDLWGYCYGGAQAWIWYSYNNGGSWILIFEEASNCTSTEPIHLQVPPTAGSNLKFRFSGSAWIGSDLRPSAARLDWLLYDLTLTFYGELALEQNTWGAIKHILN